MSREKCLGFYTGPKEEDYVPCDNLVELGEDWCKACGRKMDDSFRKAWGDIAQMENPDAKREDIDERINQVIGKPKPRLLVLMVGIPGAGKTWLLERFLPDAHVIRPDDHIGYTKENPWTPRAAKLAWDRAHADLKEALSEDGPDLIVFDATMVGAKKRRKYVRMAEKAGIYPVAMHLDTPLKVCQARNNARDKSRRVPDQAMGSMQGRMETPQTQEGFAVVMNYSVRSGIIAKSSRATDPDGDVFGEICRLMADFRKINPNQREGE